LSAKIHAIIVSYFNGAELLENISQLLQFKEITQIIIVNNGNEAEFVSILEDISPRVRIINPNKNLGFAKGCNLGARNISDDWLLFLNPDAKLYENAIENLIHDETIQKTMIGGMICNQDGSEQIGGRRGKLTILSALLAFSGLAKSGEEWGWRRNFNRHQEPLPNQAIEMPTISGAFFVICARDFHAINGFDENYFLHVEDIDFCHRFRENGGKIIFEPNARATHIGGVSSTARFAVEFHKYCGFMRYFWKSNKIIGRIATLLLAIPLLCAIMLRALLSKFQYAK
jgi:N-acetylglucosaminyl-diphospho-decaprenol L-rhamnosyltransferase